MCVRLNETDYCAPRCKSWSVVVEAERAVAEGDSAVSLYTTTTPTAAPPKMFAAHPSRRPSSTLLVCSSGLRAGTLSGEPAAPINFYVHLDLAEPEMAWMGHVIQKADAERNTDSRSEQARRKQLRRVRFRRETAEEELRWRAATDGELQRSVPSFRIL